MSQHRKSKASTPPIYKEIGHRVAICREMYYGKEHSRQLLANYTGLSASKLNSIENGYDPIMLHDLQKICGEIGIPVKTILRGLI